MLTMRLLICLLLFWITEAQLTVRENADKITCNGNPLDLPYEDTAKEYNCSEFIFIKFRTCDNCIAMDEWSMLGLAVGNLLSTALIGVAVHLVASHAQMPSRTADSQSSDRQLLIPGNSRSRGANDVYQDLQVRQPKDVYDKLGARK